MYFAQDSNVVLLSLTFTIKDYALIIAIHSKNEIDEEFKKLNEKIIKIQYNNL
jgi:hypothetical protein